MLKTLDVIDTNGKRVLVRVDFNVPIDEQGNITDDFRIRGAIPTINHLLENDAKQIVLMSHLDPWKETPAETKDPRLKMDKVAARLQELIKRPVTKVDDCVDITLPRTAIIMLENLRFHPEEMAERELQSIFAQKLAQHGDVYVNDAFGTCHRAHASVSAVPDYMDVKAAGLLVQKEIEMLMPLLKGPEQPFYAILGGTKVRDKIKVIDSLASQAAKILIGGRMALAFANAIYIDEAERNTAQSLLQKYRTKLVLPVDYVLENHETVDAQRLPPHLKAYDLGSKTLGVWRELLDDAATIVWNGPVGKFEEQPFDAATNALAAYLAASNATTIIGGGDTASAVRKGGYDRYMDHVSTGGGASLEFLEGKQLPGLKALGLYD